LGAVSGGWHFAGLASSIFVVRPLSQIVCVRAYPLSIALRKPFRHAVQVRQCADPIVVEVELADRTVGYGETLARPYVTGETVETVMGTIGDTILKALVDFRPECFADALELIDALPVRDELGDVINAARAGVELALLDAYSRYFGMPVEAAAGWLGLPGFGLPGSTGKVRYSGVLSGDDVGKLPGSVRKMRWFGLRDFKLKVGYEDDVERVRAVARVLGKSLGRRTTLRIDANGGWSFARGLEVLQALEDIPISCVEQPLSPQDDGRLVEFRRSIKFSVMHDESLITFEDARRLVELGVGDGFNIRISKNGGFLQALRFAHFARKNGVFYQLGCMVGETSILSAAGRRFLELVPGVGFAEGSYGKFLLRSDVVKRGVGFGYGGKARPLSGLGWGVEVVADLLKRHVSDRVVEYPL